METTETLDDSQTVGESVRSGAEAIAGYLPTLSLGPGVYRMLSAKGDILYVGKARSLRKRVQSYAHPARQPIRIQRMVAETASMEFVHTHTEVEALLLESNMIKQLRPRYNVLLRDDKTFPDILIRADHPFPQIVKHRGSRKAKGDYFGPFASAGSVNRTITALQKTFLLRNCTDSVFANRTRPCLQYQIKRCSAPCVDRIDEADYAVTVEQAKAFLAGRSREVQEKLASEMEQASEALDFERAASLRDRIRAMTQLQAHQDINVDGVDDADVVAIHQKGGQSCVQVFFFRGGRNNGNRAYFPSHDKSAEPEEILAAFIGQFYDNRQPPKTIMVNIAPTERALLEEAMTVRAERKVVVARPQRGAKRQLMEQAENNAREALERRLAESASQRRLLDGLAERLRLNTVLERIEVYDNSHIAGRNAVGGMIVAGPEGFMKAAYRKFNIKTPAPASKDAPSEIRGGDDFAMMREVLTRRFTRALKEDPDRDLGQWPDLVIVDGGKGQLGIAQDVFDELGIDDVALLGVAKGPEREAGRERLHVPGRPDFMLEPRDPVLYFLQRLRDEAHRFAIGAHRVKRAKAAGSSPLDDVPGIGAKRKKALLHHFGSAKAVARAGLQDLESVDGVSEAVAQKIYDFFHTEAN
ncbi:MAG: excinuclease ABC subunit UvrC [Alphaproteobacteria bacterium]